MNNSFKEQCKELVRQCCPPALLYQMQRLRTKIDNYRAYHQAGIEHGGKGFESIHRGEDCFILGAGPSVLGYDLSKLSGKNVITVANTYVHSCLKEMNPKYHVLPNVFRSHAAYYSKENYVNWLRDMDARLPKKTIMVMSIHDWQEINSNDLFSSRKVLWFSDIPWDKQQLTTINISALPGIHSVSEVAIMSAIFMGYENIYLLGFDHNYFSDKKYFYACEDHKVGLTEARVDDLLRDTANETMGTALVMQRYSMLKVLHPHIFNCNVDSYIEIFPKISFDEALKNAKNS